MTALSRDPTTSDESEAFCKSKGSDAGGGGGGGVRGLFSLPLYDISYVHTRGVTIHIPFDWIRFRLLPLDFEYFYSIMQMFNSKSGRRDLFFTRVYKRLISPVNSIENTDCSKRVYSFFIEQDLF